MVKCACQVRCDYTLHKERVAGDLGILCKDKLKVYKYFILSDRKISPAFNIITSFHIITSFNKSKLALREHCSWLHFTMSTTRDTYPADPLDIEDSSSDTFFAPYPKNGNLSPTPAAAEKVELCLRYDFISFLGVAQKLDIDFLPITWQPKLDNIGEGGTANIRQSLINLQTGFAYKRIKWSRQAQWNESKNFEALISEVLVLGNPLIRNYPNIIRLEGICWDFPPGNDNVWPVLVFEKAQNGDLDKFMNTDTGRGVNLEDRLKLCADIAITLKYIHSYCEFCKPFLM